MPNTHTHTYIHTHTYTHTHTHKEKKRQRHTSVSGCMEVEKGVWGEVWKGRERNQTKFVGTRVTCTPFICFSPPPSSPTLCTTNLDECELDPLGLSLALPVPQSACSTWQARPARVLFCKKKKQKEKQGRTVSKQASARLKKQTCLKQKRKPPDKQKRKEEGRKDDGEEEEEDRVLNIVFHKGGNLPGLQRQK